MMRLPMLLVALAVTLPVGGSQDIMKPKYSMLPTPPEPDLSMVPEQYRQIIASAATAAGIPARTLAGIAWAESSFMSAPAHRDPLDRGMFGLREAPGYHEERARLYGEYDAEDPEQAARVAAGVLADHLARFGCMPSAISAYHRGAGWVETNGIDWEYVARATL